MTDIKLDANGDLALDGDDLALIDGADEIIQQLRIRLRFFKGEWYLAPTAGVPYIEKILGKGRNPTVIKAILRKVIETTPGVIVLTDFQLTFTKSTRNLAVAAQIQIDGVGPYRYIDELVI